MTDSNDNQQGTDGQGESGYEGPDRRQETNGDGRRHEPARHGTGRRAAQGEKYST